MKKLGLILLGVLLLGSVRAQLPDSRTTKDEVVKVLEQMPAQNRAQLQELLDGLFLSGENGVLEMVRMLVPADQSSVKVEYALSGMTHYATEKGKEAQRRMLTGAYLKALDQANGRESKAFIIRQLQIVGQDELVDKLAGYLNDQSLNDPAAAALVSIDTEKSKAALLKALNTVSDIQSKKVLVRAMADVQIPEAEETLLSLLRSGNAELEPLVLTALGANGSEKSLEDLELAAGKVNYAWEKSNAVDAYITLIQRVFTQGNQKEASRAATGLMKNAEKARQLQVREAALEILFMVNPENTFKILQQALKDTERSYRNTALKYALDRADASLCSKLVDYSKKASPELKADILNALATLDENPQKRDLINNQSYTSIFIKYLNDKNLEVRKAAAFLLAKTGGENAIFALAKLLNSNDEQNIETAQNALSVTPGDIASVIAPYLSSANDKGKIAILQLLSGRKADRQVKAVFEQLNASSPDVRKTAYSTLKDVVTMNDLDALFLLLGKMQPEYTVQVQQAIISVVKSFPGDKQFEMISTRIQQTDPVKQCLYYSILSASGSDQALDFIANRFKTGDSNDKKEAFAALTGFRGVKAASELGAICNNPAEASFFDQALDAYIRIASDRSLTGENRRIYLANALEMAKTDKQKNNILKQIGQTGSYLGILLAGEYLDQPAVRQEAANAVMNIALNNTSYTGENIRELLTKVSGILDNPDAGYQKEAIRKHLDEMPLDTGFVSIFNGKDLTGWKGLVGNPISRAKMKPEELAKKQIVADELARKHWIPSGGLMVFNGTGGDNLCTTRSYGDFEMLVDWKLEPAPEADAGIYLRGTPQVQIWNTARVKVGAQVGSGGLYNNKNHPKSPLKVADNPLGEWNTFYIKMVGDRVTVMFNGILVVDNTVLENFWDRSQPIFPQEQIELQAHGSKVYYRNLYVKIL